MTDLSPAAQSVLDAAYALPLRKGQPNIAAVLRALADQLGQDLEFYNCRESMVYEILAIANELESNG